MGERENGSGGKLEKWEIGKLEKWETGKHGLLSARRVWLRL
jgi:hypothetical protein